MTRFEESIAAGERAAVTGWDFSWLEGRATEERPPCPRTSSRRRGGCIPAGSRWSPTPDEPPLPFADAAFDLVSSRHPVSIWWEEIARVLRPGGTYFAQHVGPVSAFELIEHEGRFIAHSTRHLVEARRPD